MRVWSPDSTFNSGVSIYSCSGFNVCINTMDSIKPTYITNKKLALYPVRWGGQETAKSACAHPLFRAGWGCEIMNLPKEHARPVRTRHPTQRGARNPGQSLSLISPGRRNCTFGHGPTSLLEFVLAGQHSTYKYSKMYTKIVHILMRFFKRSLFNCVCSFFSYTDL